MYELMAAPSRSDGGKIGRGVFTKHGEEITLYDDVCDILVELHTDDKYSTQSASTTSLVGALCLIRVHSACTSQMVKHQSGLCLSH